MIGAGLEVIDRVNARELLGVEDLVAQRLAEFDRAGLCGLERALGGRREDHPGVERVSREPVGGRNAVGFQKGGAELERELLGEMAVRQLLGDDHRTGRDLDAVRRLAADAHEIRIDQRDRAVGLALEAAFGEREQRQRALRARSADQHGVGPHRDDLEDLARHRGIDARVALVRHHLDAVFAFGRLGAVVDEIAPRIGEADVADVLHLVALHPVGDDLDQQRGRLRDRNPPLIRGVRLPDHRRDRDHRHLQLGRDRHHGDGRRRRGGADQQVHLLFLDQLARIAGCGRGIGAVVELDQANFFAADFILVFDRRRDAAPVRDADRGAVSAQRRHESDRDVGLRGRGRHDAGESAAKLEVLRIVSPLC